MGLSSIIDHYVSLSPNSTPRARGGVVSKSIYAIRMALRLSFITKLHFVVQKNPSKFAYMQFLLYLCSQIDKMCKNYGI